MANIHPDISPGGLTMDREVDLWYQLFYSIAGICAKLDADAGVPLTTYMDNVVVAIANGSLTNSAGASIANFVSQENFYQVSPIGIDDTARLHLIYQFTNMLETLTEQLDTDGLTDSDYEALCYTALILHRVEDTKGNILGNGTAYYFRPGGIDKGQLIEWFYNAVNAIETLTEKLDLDGTVTDANYEALWFTATVLTRVQNGDGNVVGN